MRIEYHRTLLADRVRNAAFHAALAQRHRQGRDDGGRHRRGHRFPGLPGGQARRQARRSVRGGRGRRRGAQAAAPQQARQLPHRPGALDGGGGARARRCDRVRDARQLSLRGEHHRHAQRRARALPGARRRDHPAQRRAVRLPRDGRAPLSRAGRVGRGRLRPRLRAGQGHEPQQHLRALAGAGRPAGGRRGGQRAGTRSTFDRRNKTTRAGEASWRVRQPATIYGLALWWSAELAPGVALSTGPLAPRTHWEQLYLPVLSPIAVAAGQTFGGPAALHHVRTTKAPT